MHPDTEYWRERFISEYTFREKNCHDLLDETIFIIFAELARFSKAVSECESDTDRILYLLKNMGRLHNQPKELQAEVYRRIFEACEIAAFTEDKRIQYERDMYDERRRNGELAAAREEGMEQGLAAGELAGRKATARKLLEMGMPLEQVVEATGLDRSVVESL